MSQSSSQRFGLEPAPGGLVIVQELVNTALADPRPPVPDLLAELTPARAWLAHALAQWGRQTGQTAPAAELGARDLPRLRALREAVRRDEAGAEPLPIELELTAAGVCHRPAGTGWKLVASLVYAEILLAQHAGTWDRLKRCENPVCGTAFYDRTRNGSRVWHDTKTCGNVMNLRASRARRKGRPLEH